MASAKTATRLTAHSLFLNHPQPFPNEALKSWLWRLAYCNYVHSPSVLLRYLRDMVSATMPNISQVLYSIRESRDFMALAEATNSSVTTIYAHTLYRFAHLLTQPHQETTYLTLASNVTLRLLSVPPGRDYYTPHFSWCPACLAEARYVRLHWHIPFVTCCDVHHCWLSTRCPNCQTWVKESDILQGFCLRCNVRFEQMRALPVPAGDLLLTATSVVLDWLYERQVSPQMHLPDIPVAVLIRVLQGLRHAAQRAGDGWDFHHVPPGTPVPTLDIVKRRSLTPIERGCLYATAFRGLQDWPDGFCAFLDAYRKRPAPKEKTGLRREFGTLYISWLRQFWKHPAFEFIQSAFNDYLVDRVPVYQIMDSTRTQDYPDLIDRLDYLDRKRTTAYLDICISSVYRLVAEKNLTPCHFEGDLDIWFAREELDCLKQKWRKHLIWRQVSRRLGISLEAVQRFTEAGLLRVVPIEEGIKEQKTYIDEGSVHALLVNLKQFTTIQTNENDEGIPLRIVCYRHATVKMNSAALLKRVLDGKLPAYHPHETLFPLRAMWFMAEDVDDLSETVKSEQDWFTKAETKAYLGVGWRIFNQLLKTGFLSPVFSLGQKVFFSRSEVQAFHQQWILTGQIGAILQVPAYPVYQLIEQGAFQITFNPMVEGDGCYIFDRAEFQSWHEAHILLPEMRTLTGDLRALQRSLKTMGIGPLINTPTVYSRTAVMMALNQHS